MAGATAVGGGDLTVVVLFDVESVVLLDVESVTIASAYVNDENTNNAAANILPYFFDCIFYNFP
jgi:hypothetical protein